MEAVHRAARSEHRLEDDGRPVRRWPREKHAGQPRPAHKVGDEWLDISYAELGDAVSEIALGLIDLGIEQGDKVVDPQPHPPRVDATPTSAILAAGAASVSIYQTNSPEECHYVLEHSESQGGLRRGRRAAGEDPRGRGPSCPQLEHIDRLRARRRRHRRRDLARRPARARPRPRRGRARASACDAVDPRRPRVFIYTSGTTGPPKGCMLTHGNYRDDHDDDRAAGRARGGRRRLPLPPARARLRAAGPVRGDRPRRHDRLLGEGPAEDHPQPHRGQADLLPVGAADVREDLHARHRERRRTRSSSSRRSSSA